MARRLLCSIFRGQCFTRPLLAASVVRYTFNDDDDKVSKPEKPILFPAQDQLTPEFLIRQSCTLSSQQAHLIAMLTVNALEDSINSLSQSISELANLFESSVTTGFALTEAGHHRVVELQEDIRDSRKSVSDLEMLFHFVKKLLEANAEVAFIAGAETVSVQSSERLFSFTQHVEKLTSQVKTLEMDLVKVQQRHIEFVGSLIKVDDAEVVKDSKDVKE